MWAHYTSVTIFPLLSLRLQVLLINITLNVSPRNSTTTLQYMKYTLYLQVMTLMTDALSWASELIMWTCRSFLNNVDTLLRNMAEDKKLRFWKQRSVGRFTSTHCTFMARKKRTQQEVGHSVTSSELVKLSLTLICHNTLETYLLSFCVFVCVCVCVCVLLLWREVNC